MVIGAKKFLTNYGLGAISPNTIVLGEVTKPENFTYFLSIVQFATKAKKNVLIIRDRCPIRPSSKELDIWWDDSSRYNSEPMILLCHMLTSNKVWKKARIHIKSIVPSESRP